MRKNKGTAECDKNIVTCDVGIAQCENGTIKYKKKAREPPNVIKELSYVMLESHNVRNCTMWEKGRGTTQCDKRTVICDVGTTQCDDRTVKCEKKKWGNHRM